MNDPRAGFDQLLAELRPKLHRYCSRMTGSVIDGEDVLQEALVKAIEAFPRAGPIAKPEGWLFRIAHNAALDALRSILIEELLAASDISEIHVGVGHMTFVHTAWDYRPAGVTAAQMNMYYGLSVMAFRQDVSAADYVESQIADAGILEFIRKITIEEDAELESRGPAFRHAARLRVLADDGRTFTREVLHRRGSPENPVGRQDVERKFNSNLDGLLAPDARSRLIELCSTLEKLPHVKAINDIVGAPIAREPH